MTETESLPHYIGCKSIQAKPMTLGRYNTHRGWTIPQNEDPERPGYLVVYPDGYQSWSPQAAFESAYLQLESPKGDKITLADVNDFIADSTVIHRTARTTVCKYVLANGYEFIESSSCVSPENYSEHIGIEICNSQAQRRIWDLLGFLLRTAKFGVPL